MTPIFMLEYGGIKNFRRFLWLESARTAATDLARKIKQPVRIRAGTTDWRGNHVEGSLVCTVEPPRYDR